MLIPFQELCSKYAIRPKGVVHLGGHFAQERIQYANNGVEECIWVEAIPEVFETLKRNIATFAGHRAFCACLSDVDDKDVVFHVASNEGQSSSYLEFGTHATVHPDVRFTHDLNLKTTRFDTLAKKHVLFLGPDWFINLDLQGAELLALKGCGDLLWQFQYAYVEVNQFHLYKACPLVGEIDDFLAGFGFEPVETKWEGSFGWGDRYFARIK